MHEHIAFNRLKRGHGDPIALDIHYEPACDLVFDCIYCIHGMGFHVLQN